MIARCTSWRALCLLLTVSLGALTAAQDVSSLLGNPGFEEGDGPNPAGWASACTGGSSAYRDTSQGFTGRACGYIRKVQDGESHVAALSFPRIDVTPGGTYTLSGWGKSHVPQGRALLFLYQYDREGKWLGNFFASPVPTDTDDWTPLRATEKVRDDCAWVQVRFEIYGVPNHGEAWVDDVYFGPDTTPPAPVDGLTVTQTGRRASLTWRAPAGEQPFVYQVHRAPYARFSPGPDSLIATTRDTSADDTVPDEYLHYYYAVIARDFALNGADPTFAGPVASPAGRDLPDLTVWTDGPARRWPTPLPNRLPEGPAEVAIEAARGEWESFQVLVGAPKGRLEGVQVRVRRPIPPPKGPVPDLEVYLQEYVSLPGRARWTPDPLVPARAVDIEPGALRGWWLLVHVPEDVTAGEYHREVVVSAEGHGRVRVPVRIKVWPVTVPPGNHYGGSWGIWPVQLAQQEKMALGSPEFARLHRRYARFFLEHRMVPRGLPFDLLSDEGKAWVRDPRVSAFALPWRFAGLPTEEERDRALRVFDYLRAEALLGKGYVYIYDEPTEEDYEKVAGLCRALREAAPDVPILLTEQPEEVLHDYVDLWCPGLGGYAQYRDRCEERRAAGKQVWWYVCCGPLPPWPNYLLTNDPIDGRVLSWMQVKHGVQGELYWAVTCFPGDVWAEAGPASAPGDGYLCYPGAPRGLEGPVTCIRAEVIRDAKEDIELIWLLRQVAAKAGPTAQARAEVAIEKSVGTIITDFTHYTKSAADIAAARRGIVDQILRLQGQ